MLKVSPVAGRAVDLRDLDVPEAADGVAAAEGEGEHGAVPRLVADVNVH